MAWLGHSPTSSRSDLETLTTASVYIVERMKRVARCPADPDPGRAVLGTLQNVRYGSGIGDLGWF